MPPDICISQDDLIDGQKNRIRHLERMVVELKREQQISTHEQLISIISGLTALLTKTFKQI